MTLGDVALFMKFFSAADLCRVDPARAAARPAWRTEPAKFMRHVKPRSVMGHKCRPMPDACSLALPVPVDVAEESGKRAHA